MTNNLIQDVSSLPDSPIVNILRDESKDLQGVESSEAYDWDEVKETIMRIEDMIAAAEAKLPAQDLVEYEVAVIAAYAAMLVAGATTKSSAASTYVARICRRVFGLFQLELGLSEIQQYRLYRNAYEASRGAEEYVDDMLFELRNADLVDLRKDPNHE